MKVSGVPSIIVIHEGKSQTPLDFHQCMAKLAYCSCVLINVAKF